MITPPPNSDLSFRPVKLADPATPIGLLALVKATNKELTILRAQLANTNSMGSRKLESELIEKVAEKKDELKTLKRAFSTACYKQLHQLNADLDKLMVKRQKLRGIDLTLEERIQQIGSEVNSIDRMVNELNEIDYQFRVDWEKLTDQLNSKGSILHRQQQSV